MRHILPTKRTAFGSCLPRYGLLLNYARQMGWDAERGSINLTNTAKPYPFNNSQKTVAFADAAPQP